MGQHPNSDRSREQPRRSNSASEMVPRARAGSSLLSMGKESNRYMPPAARINRSLCSAVSISCIHLAHDTSRTFLLVSKEGLVNPDFRPGFLVSAVPKSRME